MFDKIEKGYLDREWLEIGLSTAGVEVYEDSEERGFFLVLTSWDDEEVHGDEVRKVDKRTFVTKGETGVLGITVEPVQNGLIVTEGETRWVIRY